MLPSSSEDYEAGLTTLSRKSMRERKAAPGIWELAWHLTVGLGILLLDINDFPEH